MSLNNEINIEIGNKSHEYLTNWAKRFGEIYGFKAGRYHFITLNSYAAIREALVQNGEVFNARHNDTFQENLNPHKYG